jgi:hypothetical protein
MSDLSIFRKVIRNLKLIILNFIRFNRIRLLLDIDGSKIIEGRHGLARYC